MTETKIRTRYMGVDPDFEVIPAIATDEIAFEQRALKVAAMFVCHENDEQRSYELQVRLPTDQGK